jgi:hypothetical protein
MRAIRGEGPRRATGQGAREDNPRLAREAEESGRRDVDQAGHPGLESEFSTVTTQCVVSRYVMSAGQYCEVRGILMPDLDGIKHFLDIRRSQDGSSPLVISII